MDAQAIVFTIGSLLMSPEDDRITGKNQSLYAEPLDEVFTPYRKEWLKNWFERFTLEHQGRANLSFEDATNMCLSNNVPSFIHISFGEAWDSFHTIHYVKDRIGMKKKKEHRITGINPAEVLDKVQSTLGMTVPKIPSDMVKESSGEKV